MSARRLSRRNVIRGIGGAALGVALSRGVEPAAAAANPLPDSILPPDLGQTDLQVFIPETGHTLRGSMLDYWRANGAAPVYGNPISEPFEAKNGFYTQAFERGVFQYRPEFL